MIMPHSAVAIEPTNPKLSAAYTTGTKNKLIGTKYSVSKCDK
jgi:hypothetical protein